MYGLFITHSSDYSFETDPERKNRSSTMKRKKILAPFILALQLPCFCRAVRILPSLRDHSNYPQDTFVNITKGKASYNRQVKARSPEDHLVTTLPYLDSSSFHTKHYAGHLPASQDESDKQLFYWLFAPDFSNNNQSDSDKVPLIIWLNGGPGCSSLIGLFIENGPFSFVLNGGSYNLEINPFSWHKAPAWLLFIDQPVGTGLSYTTKHNYCDTDAKINADFYYFLTQFFLLHRDVFLFVNGDGILTVKRPFFFSGESHAGHYIPSMMNFILVQNDSILTGTTTGNPNAILMPLSGAAIGNGNVLTFVLSIRLHLSVY